MKRSSALLVGVGGSGKQCLTRLAADIGRHITSQLVLTKTYNENNLKEDIKYLFDVAGHKGKPISFLLTDAEVKHETFLEYINMVLSTGEIPGLIPKDEKEIWLGDVRTEFVKKFKDNKEPSAMEIYDYFLDRLRDNLHIVLCFSPVGNKFRERARKFPALFNECSIDWFMPWPAEALGTVAEQSLARYGEIHTTPEIMAELPKWMANVHNQVNDACDLYYAKMRRSVFVTPKSYLSFLASYQDLYGKKYAELDEAEQKFNIGLQKISEAKEDIALLEKGLKKEEEKLKIKREEVDVLITELNKQKAAAQKRGDEVGADKTRIEGEAAVIGKEKLDCQASLDIALPALFKAQQAAAKITIKDIAELKGNPNPHIVMKYVVDAMA